MSEVKVGQIWKDRDYRMHGRHFRIIAINDKYAACQPCNGHGDPSMNRVVRILLRRFKPTSTGYDLVAEPKADLARGQGGER